MKRIKELVGEYYIDEDGNIYNGRRTRLKPSNGTFTFRCGDQKQCRSITKIFRMYYPDNARDTRTLREAFFPELSPTDYNSLRKRYDSLIKRCYDPCDRQYKDYGGRGIDVCDEWRQEFKSFVEWAIGHGYKRGLSMDRIDNEKGYFPNNVRFTDSLTQNNNTRANILIVYNGRHYTLSQFCRKYNLKYKTAHSLYRQYKEMPDIGSFLLDAGQRRNKKIVINGVSYSTYKEVADRYNINYWTLLNRHQQGETGASLIRPIDKSKSRT